jgi:DNA repair photolyase
MRKLKDKGQREDCGCVFSKDIGGNTCPHECNYCYANASKELATKIINHIKLPRMVVL